MPPSTQRILGFDGLRAIAFLLVFVSHKIPTGATQRYGAAGVWLFFVLSGFLITRILMHSRAAVEQRREGLLSHLLVFWTRRSLRIMPVYYVFLGVMTLLSVYGLADLGSRMRQLSNVIFLSNFYIERNGWGALGHLWSLAVEEQFYIFFAPLVLLSPLRQLGYICAGILAVSVVAHVVLFIQGRWSVSFDANSFVNFGLMAIGGLAGMAADRRRLPKALTSEAAICAALGAYLVLPLLISPMQLWLQVGRVSGLLAALLLLQVYQRQDGWAVGFLNTAPLRLLGVVSYGAYLFHEPINSAGILAQFGCAGEVPMFARAALDLGATVVLAGLSWRFLETPFRNMARRRNSSIVPSAAT